MLLPVAVYLRLVNLGLKSDLVAIVFSGVLYILSPYRVEGLKAACLCSGGFRS